MRIRDLPGLGLTSERQLAEIGIDTVDALRDLGPARAYLALRFRFGRSITLNYLWATGCGLNGLHWRDLPLNRKSELRAEVAALEAAARGKSE